MDESREDLSHPEGEVGGCGSQEEVDAVALLALEEVATEAEVAFEMADAGFDGSPEGMTVVVVFGQTVSSEDLSSRQKTHPQNLPLPQKTPLARRSLFSSCLLGTSINPVFKHLMQFLY